MSKAIIWILIIIGLLLLVIGLVFDTTALWIIGLLMVVVGLYVGLRPGGILRKDEVIDSWTILIEQGQGRAGEIFEDTKGYIEKTKAPSVRVEKREMAPGLIRGAFGTRRIFLVITDQDNFRLRPYQIFINSRDYGTNLDVSWHLTYRPSVWQAVLSLFPFVRVIPATLSDLDLFDQQDLRAYATNAHHCLLKAVEKLMIALNQDPSKIERKSRGFLGIS